MVSFSSPFRLYSTPGLSAATDASMLEGIILPSLTFAPGTVICSARRNMLPSDVTKRVVATRTCDWELNTLYTVILPVAFWETVATPLAGKNCVVVRCCTNISAGSVRVSKLVFARDLSAMNACSKFHGVFLRFTVTSAQLKNRLIIIAPPRTATTSTPRTAHTISHPDDRFLGSGTHSGTSP